MRGNSKVDDKLLLLTNELNDSDSLLGKLKDIYQAEFEEKIDKILVLNEEDFIKSFEERIRLIIEDMYSQKALQNRQLLSIMKTCMKQIVDVQYKTVSGIVRENYIPEEKKRGVTIRFNKHCKNCTNIPLHTCRSRFYPIIDEKNNITYLVCLGCELVYSASSVLMSCEQCETEFYTAILENGESGDIAPATWDKYHCSALINDQMRCIKCKNYLFLNLKKNLLVCKSCNFEADPKTIVWICMLCKGEFKTDAKVYNKLEYKLIKLAIKEALLNKINSKPTYLPCCSKNTTDITFIHKKECDGKLFQSDLIKGRKIVVCEKCKMMNDYDKFIWTCPLCYKRFKQKLKDDETDAKVKKSETDRIRRTDSNKTKEEESAVEKVSASSSANNLDKISSEPIQYKKKAMATPFTANKNKTDILVTGKHRKDEDEESETVSSTPTSQTKALGKNQKNQHSQSVENIEKISNYSSNNNPNNRQSPAHTSHTSHSQSREKTPPKGLGLIKLLDKGNKMLNISPTASDLKNFVEKSKFYPSPENNSPGSRECKSTKNTTKGLEMDSYIDSIEATKEFTIDEDCAKKITILPTRKKTEDQDEDNCTELQEFVFEDYKVLNQIGEGSYGKIYVVTNKTSSKQFSLKKIITSEQEEIDQIYKEYELVNSIRHKGILRIRGTCYKKLDATTHALYVLMDLAKYDWDKEIKTRLTSKKQYTEEELLNILFQVTDALAFLQSKNISHRDIKPQNILVFENNKYKLADFGEAKELVRRKYNQTDTLRGTELFMSPVLFYALQNNKYDIKHNCYKSDVYSVGLSMVYAAALVYNPIYDLKANADNRTVNLVIDKYFKKKYSGKFLTLLAKMLELNESQRPDFIKLLEYLKSNF